MEPESPLDITTLLRAWSDGDASALDRLAPILQAELKRIARRHMAHERRNHTLQPTALVNEAYLRLIDAQQVQWQNRAHFFALAAQMMRRILVNHAVARNAAKRGGRAFQVSLHDALAAAPVRDSELIRLDEALEALALIDPRKVKVVELRFFGGLDVKETATVLNVSSQTVLRDWSLAKTWLAREMSRQPQ